MLETHFDQSKIKARGLLIQKELQERKIKIIVQKLESHMKGTLGMSQEEVNRISRLSADELLQLHDMERELEGEL